MENGGSKRRFSLKESALGKGILADLAVAQGRVQRNDVSSIPAAAGVGGMFLVAVGGAVVLTVTVFCIITMHVAEQTPATGPWLGANVLAWLAQSLAVLLVILGSFSLVYGAFSGWLLEEPSGSHRIARLFNQAAGASVSRVGRAAAAALLRIAAKSGTVAVLLLIGYIGLIAVFPPNVFGDGAAGHPVPEELAKLQFGAGATALIVIVLYECIRVLEDLLALMPRLIRLLGIAFFASYGAVFVTGGFAMFQFTSLYQHILGYWLPGADYGPYTRAGVLAQLDQKGAASPWWAAVLVMLALFGFRLLWLRLTRPPAITAITSETVDHATERQSVGRARVRC